MKLECLGVCECVQHMHATALQHVLLSFYPLPPPNSKSDVLLRSTGDTFYFREHFMSEFIITCIKFLGCNVSAFPRVDVFFLLYFVNITAGFVKSLKVRAWPHTATVALWVGGLAKNGIVWEYLVFLFSLFGVIYFVLTCQENLLGYILAYQVSKEVIELVTELLWYLYCFCLETVHTHFLYFFIKMRTVKGVI